MRLPLFIFLLLPCIVRAQSFCDRGSFTLKGDVKNFHDTSFTIGITNFTGQTKFAVQIDAGGKFNQSFPVNNTQSLLIQVNDYAYNIYVRNNDNITLQWNDDDIDKSISIADENAIRAKELQKELAVSKLFNKEMMNLRHDYGTMMPAEEDKKKICASLDSLFNNGVRICIDSGAVSNNLNNFIAGFYFSCSGIIEKLRLPEKYQIKLTANSSVKYAAIDINNSSPDFHQPNNNWFWNVPEYRNYFFSYKRFFDTSFKNPNVNYGTSDLNNFSLKAVDAAKACLHPDFIKEWFIANVLMGDLSYYPHENVEKAYTESIDVIKNNCLKEMLQEKFSNVQYLKKGSEAPDFTLKDDNGNSVSLSGFKNKLVYLDFWGISCGPCVHAIKNYFPILHTKYKDVVFINICVDSDEKGWKAALEKYHLDGINLIAPGFELNRVCKTYNINSVPRYFLINKNGSIANASQDIFPDELMQNNNVIDRLLKAK